MKNTKARYWTFISYPESSFLEYICDKLIETGLRFCISPLHDKDINPDGTPKKAHYHIMVIYEGPTTYNNVLLLTQSLNCTIPQPVSAVRGMYRYFIHLDNPDKYQYDQNDIICGGGFNPKDFIDLSYSEVSSIIKYLINYIIDNNIFEYSELIDSLMKVDKPEFLDVATNHTIFFNTYLTSRRNKERQK